MHERGARTVNLLGAMLLVLLVGMAVTVDTRACERTYSAANLPKDATDPANAWLVNDVRTYHCNASVRALKGDIHGNRRKLMSDINYALQRIPNHRDCLTAVVKYQAKKGYPFFPEEAKYPTAECYIRNAQSLFPHDMLLWSLEGLNYYYHDDFKASAATFERILEKQPKNAEAYYNLGLARFQMKDYKASAEAAKQAYSLGFPLKGLQRKLTKAGAWPATTP